MSNKGILKIIIEVTNLIIETNEGERKICKKKEELEW